MRHLAATVLLGLLLAPAAAAQEPPRASPLEPAARQLGEALAFVAATKGDEAALRLAGDLPERLRDALRAMARSDRAEDIRAVGGQLDVQAAMLPALIDETPGARGALDALAADASARLERELTAVEKEVERVRSAAAALQRDAAAQALASRLAVAARPGGPELLLLAAQAPLLEADLALVKDGPARYRLLAGHFERRTDALVGPTLVALATVRDQAARELRATGDTGEVAAAARDAERRLSWAVQRLAEAATTAVEGVRLVRDEELGRVGKQNRGSELEQALRMEKAYRKQFQELPDLQATTWSDVYQHRVTTRIHVWLDGEDRWVQGPPRVDPVAPVVEALLRAPEPDLRARAVDPASLARVYLLFDRRAERPPGPLPFAEGLARAVRNGQALAQRWRALRALGAEQGLDAGALDAALEARLGVAPEVLGEPGPAGADADARVATRVGAALLRAAAERGPEAGADLARSIDEALADVQQVRFEAASIALEGRPPGAAVDLVWDPDPDGPAAGTFLVRPPERLAADADRVSVILVGGAEASLGGEVWAHAWAGGKAFVGRAALRAGGTAPVRLAEAPGPSLVSVGRVGPAGLRIVQVPRDAPPVDLFLEGPGPRRPLAPAPGGGAWAMLTPDERGGACTVVGLDPRGEVQARLGLSLGATRGVQVASEGAGGPWWVAPGGNLEARVTSGGAIVPGQHAFRIEGPGGVAYQAARETLRWTVELPPGRYRVAVEQKEPISEGERIEPAPLVVVKEPPRVVAVFDPHRGSPRNPFETTVPAGAGLFLRVDAWPVLLPDEVRRVRWTIEGGSAPVTATTWASSAWPDVACLLPLQLDPKAAPGSRRVVAAVETARGTLQVEGRFTIGAPAVACEVDLRAPDGDVLRAVPLGPADGPLLRTRPALKGATWVLVGPSRRARVLAPRFDGQVPLVLEEHDLTGVHEAWVLGTAPDGKPAAGRLELLTHAPATLALGAPAAPRVGQEVAITATPPAWFEAPFKVRVAGAPWVAGTRAMLLAKADNDVTVLLEDARGRRTRGRVTFKATREVAAEPASTARFGIAANVTQKRIFAADYALLQNYLRKDLPADWVILEPQAMTAAKVRDRLFATCPYDAPSTDPQVAYRSKRFWSGLQESARKRFEALGVEEGAVYDVLDSPSPSGEETLDALVARLIAEQGAWDYRLLRVRVVKADGASTLGTPPRDPQEPVRFAKAGASGEGSAVDRIEVPGPLGDLRLRPLLPATITLGKPARMAFTVLSTRSELLAGRKYPGGLETVLPSALLCPELEVELVVEDKKVGGVTRRVGKKVGGVDVGVFFEPTGTDRVEAIAGQPRRAERYRIAVEPFTTDAPTTLETRFDPIPPGVLQPEPRTLVVTVRARLVPAVPRASWPANRPMPEPVTIEGAPYVLLRDGLPDVVIELVATYQRQAPDGLKPWPATLPPMAAVRGDAQLPPIADAPDGAARTATAIERGDVDEAEDGARRAVYTRPEDPLAWALLADVLLQRRRPVEALGRARWSLALGPNARAWVVSAEAAFADGELEEARSALQAATGSTEDPALQRRMQRLRRQLGM